MLLTLHGRHPAARTRARRLARLRRQRAGAVGNGAADQHQLDGYGWVLDAAWLLVQAGHHLYSETWRAMRGFADLVARRWQEPDAGIWEIRGDAAHHVHSKLMGWLALDRALRIADTHRTPRPATAALADRARRHRRRGPSARLRPEPGAAYTRSYGSTDLDAALLVLPLLGIERRRLPTGARHDRRHPPASSSAGGPLLYRYPPGRDGLPGTEGAFLPCSFWLVQALARTGRRAEAVDAVRGRCSSSPARSGSTPRRWTRPPAPTSATSRRP